MTCDRCQKNETAMHNISITANAWQPQRRLCSNCIGWLQTYFERFMLNDFDLNKAIQSSQAIPMLLHCPECGQRHIDVGEFETKSHHTHACQNCGMVWRPAIGPTVGVRFLPGFKNGGGE